MQGRDHDIKANRKCCLWQGGKFIANTFVNTKCPITGSSQRSRSRSSSSSSLKNDNNNINTPWAYATTKGAAEVKTMAAEAAATAADRKMCCMPPGAGVGVEAGAVLLASFVGLPGSSSVRGCGSGGNRANNGS